MTFAFINVGYGHNGAAYIKGKMVNFSYNPQTNAVGVQWMDGESVMVGSKENTTLDVEMKDTSGVQSGTDSGLTNGTISKIKYSTGIQINGYMVDLAEANPEFALEVLKAMQESGKETKYFVVKDGKLAEVTKEEYDKTTDKKCIIDGKMQTVTAQ